MKSPRLKKAWNVISTIIVVIFVFCAVFLMGSRVLGYQSARFTEGLIYKETSWSFKIILTVFLLFKISFEGIFKSPS